MPGSHHSVTTVSRSCHAEIHSETEVNHGQDQRSIEMLGFVLAFLGIGIAYFAIHLGIRHDRYKRELEHNERMSALELGRSLPGDTPWLSPARLGFLIASVVPIGIFGFAWLATSEARLPSRHLDGRGHGGLGQCHAGRARGLRMATARTDRAHHQAELVLKPEIAEDAYDVVSSRLRPSHVPAYRSRWTPDCEPSDRFSL